MDAAWILLVLVAAGANSQPANDASNSSTKPVEHRVNFAGQANWSGTPVTAPPAVSYDRYGQPITPIGQATQSVADRTQTAISQSGAALKDGFDAGVRATSQQLSSTNPFAAPTAPSASAPTGVSSPWANNPGSAPPAPSWQSNPATPGIVATGSNPAASTATTTGWSSIGSSVAAPPLLIPQSPMSYPSYGATTASAGRNGPNFPAIAASETQPLHSVLTEPSSSTAKSAVVNRADDLAAGWGDNTGSQQPSIGRNGSQPSLGSTVRESDLVPLSTNNSTARDQRYTNTDRTSSGFQNNDGWPQQAQPNLSTQPMIESASVNRQPPAPTTNGMTNPAVSSPFANQPPVQPQNGQQSPQMGNINTVSTSPNMNGMGNLSNPNANSNSTTQKGSGTASDQPWMPLILAVLTLAGSLAANLFLGMSYLDARQKYQSLVRKTADTFRRVKAAAA